MTCGIYLITCLATEEKYVGRSHCIEGRWQTHIQQLQGGTHHSNCFQSAWNEHGIESFSFQVLEVCDLSECPKKEAEWSKNMGVTLASVPEDLSSRSKNSRQNSRLFWQWVRSKGGKTVQDASRLTSEFRQEWIEYRDTYKIQPGEILEWVPGKAVSK